MSSNSKPGRARARRTQLPRWTVPKGIAILECVCRAGERSKSIARSQPGRQALADLQATVTAANKTLSTKGSLVAMIAQASKALRAAVAELLTELRLYETTVAAVSRGDAAVMRAAGFRSRGPDPSRVFGTVTGMKGKPGVHAEEGVVGWPRVPFAVRYVLEVRFNPDSPVERWRTASTGTSRRRVVKGPEPAAKIQARVAAVKRDGTRSEWSGPILVQTR